MKNINWKTAVTIAACVGIVVGCHYLGIEVPAAVGTTLAGLAAGIAPKLFGGES